MATAPSPSWADTRPAWVGELRRLLSQHEPLETAPPAEPDHATMLATAAARHWLDRVGADAARQLAALFGNAAGLRCTWAVSGGQETLGLRVDVWAVDALRFRYVLELRVTNGAILPRVTTRHDDTVQEHALQAWLEGVGSIEAVTVNDVCADFAARYREALTPRS